MKIILDETELKSALVSWVKSQGVDTVGKDIDVSFKAGRGVNGYEAEIEINSSTKVAEVPTGSIAKLATPPTKVMSLVEEVAQMEIQEEEETKGPASLFNK